MLILHCPWSCHVDSPLSPTHIYMPESKIKCTNSTDSTAYHWLSLLTYLRLSYLLNLGFEWLILLLMSLLPYNYVYIVEIIFIQQGIIKFWSWTRNCACSGDTNLNKSQCFSNRQSYHWCDKRHLKKWWEFSVSHSIIKGCQNVYLMNIAY